MLYVDYIRRTTPAERLLNQLFLGLEGAKEAHEHWHIQQERDEQEQEQAAIDPRS